VVFTSVSTLAGFIFVCADIVMIPLLIIYGIKLMVKSPVTLKKSLSSTDGVTSQAAELNEYLGMECESITDLRPSGAALINEKRVDVISRGEYIEKGSKIVVCAVEGNQVVVKRKL
jgi:membrane-bound ClpP family serine protease